MGRSVRFLDDPQAILRGDPSGMRHRIEELPDQLVRGFRIGQALRCPASYRSVSSVVFTGMGGSAIGGDLARSYLSDRMKISLWVNRNYALPSFVGPDTLVVATSYSGETEETIVGFQEARLRKAKLLVLAAGGTLARKARDLGVPWVKLPAGYPPRSTLGFSFASAVAVFAKLGFSVSAEASVLKAATALRGFLRRDLAPSVPSAANPAKRLAGRLLGRFPVVYASGDHLEAVVCRWRSQLNENAKTLALGGLFPEMNHNEIVGWDRPRPILRRTAVLFLRDREDHPRNRRRMALSARMIRTLGVPVEEIASRGADRLTRLFSLVLLADYTSLYLGLLEGVDPTPVEPVERIKKKLGRIVR